VDIYVNWKNGFIVTGNNLVALTWTNMNNIYCDQNVHTIK